MQRHDLHRPIETQFTTESRKEVVAPAQNPLACFIEAHQQSVPKYYFFQFSTYSL
jgi:hypothetical protein